MICCHLCNQNYLKEVTNVNTNFQRISPLQQSIFGSCNIKFTWLKDEEAVAVVAADEDETDAVALALIAVFCELIDADTELVADDDVEPDPSLILFLTLGTYLQQGVS